MIPIDWNPVAHLGPIPINWYGLGWAAAIAIGWTLLARWAPRYGFTARTAEDLLIWILLGTLIGARAYFIVQNDPGSYLLAPWRAFAIWEGGLAFFGGLFGGIAGGYVYARRHRLSFISLADLVAPAVPIGGAIGRVPCFLAGMDYGTPTTIPWGVVYTHPASYAPNDGVPRHPVQLYELIGDLVIATVLLRLRSKLPSGTLFPIYLVLFTALRFTLFFVRGDVPAVALGLTNGHWTSVAIFAAGTLWLWRAGARVTASGAVSEAPRKEAR